jgi:hypothetical protein
MILGGTLLHLLVCFFLQVLMACYSDQTHYTAHYQVFIEPAWIFLFNDAFQYLRLYSVDFYSILIRLPSSSEVGETRVRNMAEFSGSIRKYWL